MISLSHPKIGQELHTAANSALTSRDQPLSPGRQVKKQSDHDSLPKVKAREENDGPPGPILNYLKSEEFIVACG